MAAGGAWHESLNLQGELLQSEATNLHEVAMCTRIIPIICKNGSQAATIHS